MKLWRDSLIGLTLDLSSKPCPLESHLQLYHGSKEKKYMVVSHLSWETGFQHGHMCRCGTEQ